MLRRSSAHLALFAFSTLTMLAACASSAVPASTVSIPPETTAPPASAPPADTTEALVWTLDDKGASSTRWIRPDHGAYAERSAMKSVLIAVDADVWRWSEKEEPIKTEACESFNTTPGEGKGVRGIVERLGTPEHVEVISPPNEGGANEIQHGVELEGSVGPYLVLRESTYSYSCGAHGGVGVLPVTWDLKSRSKVEMLSTAEVAALDKAERLEAQKQLPAFEDTVKFEDVAFKAALPRYNERGALHFDDAFSTFACYACSTGSWGSYSASVDITAHQLPERARPFAKTPSAVVAWAIAHPKARIGGWSEVTPSAARVLSTVLPK